jgi:ATP-dependent helicase HrpA
MAGLPILEWRDEIMAAVRDHPVVVVAGETGSGKSTQLPQMCLDAGRGTDRMIGHTQPRRIAARAVAERVAEELGTEVGGLVGYAVRFTDRVGPRTRVKVMTDGILLNEVHRDRDLSRYDTIIVDEAHERSLNIDFLLGYLHRLLARRTDLRVVITSATIDTARVAAHFEDAPVISVEGRSYPVEVRYRPYDDETSDEVQAVADAVGELTATGPGDVLVFLSGEREIRDTTDALARSPDPALAGIEVLPLYGRLSAAEQHRVFAPHDGRRVVLATNVAETSLTVPGIRFVVDPGTARVSRYSTRTKVQRLPIEAVSRASADQRAGRCGRVAPGICVRLYGEEDFLARPAFTEPEILRTNLASVVLQMAALRLGDVADFPFVDPPDRPAVQDAVLLLQELGAFSRSASGGAPRITPLGRRLAQLPIDPRLGRMLLEGERLGCAQEVAVIAAALSIQDPRERPADRSEAWQEKHGRFAGEQSDFLSYLALWDYLQEQQRLTSSSAFRRLCRADFLNYLRVREWQDLVAQLGRAVTLPGSRGAAPRTVHRALLAGLLSQIGMRDREAREYRGARGTRFTIAPGSMYAKKMPAWVMAAELVETNRLWARVVAPVRPEWAEQLAGDLATRSYGEPWWDARRGQAMTAERVALYGLPIVAGRPVPCARVNRPGARDIFVHHALVLGDCRGEHPFLAANRRMLEDVFALEERARRRLAIGEHELFDLYDARVPDDIVTVDAFDHWWSGQPDDALTFEPQELMAPGAAVDPGDFPSAWRQDDLVLPLTYRFDPTAPDDGITVHIPLAALDRVAPEGFDWLIPGWRDELVTALIRTLPKAVRRNFVPAPDFARRFLHVAHPGDGPLLERLEAVLPPMTGDPIPPGSWRPEQLPAHLRATFAVHDADGRVTAQGEDLRALQRHTAPLVREAIVAALPGIERSGERRWEFGTIPAEMAHGVARGYPALVDEGETVGLRVMATTAEQRAAMWSGTRRLLRLATGVAPRSLQRDLPPSTALSLARAAAWWPPTALLDHCIDAAVDELLSERGGPVRDEQGFEDLRAFVAPRLRPRATAVARDAIEDVALAATLAQRLAGATSPRLRAAVEDMERQLGGLVPPEFPRSPGATRLGDVHRYLRGIERRLDKLPEDPHRDARAMATVHALEDEHERLVRALSSPVERAEARRLRWMLEELRVGLFAESLQPAYRVSEARVRRAFAQLASTRG